MEKRNSAEFGLSVENENEAKQALSRSFQLQLTSVSISWRTGLKDRFYKPYADH
jgi:hypothetical protein